MKKLFWTMLLVALVVVALKQRQEGFDVNGMKIKMRDASQRFSKSAAGQGATAEDAVQDAVEDFADSGSRQGSGNGSGPAES